MPTIDRPALMAAHVAQAQAEIRAMILRGTLPARIESFDVLHDHIDANTLGGMCDEDVSAFLVLTFGESGADEFFLDWQNEVHGWIVRGMKDERDEPQDDEPQDGGTPMDERTTVDDGDSVDGWFVRLAGYDETDGVASWDH